MLLYEIIITLFAILLNLFLYKKSNTNKFSKIEMTFFGLVSPLIVFISIYMVSDTITVDEMQYMNVISNMHHILDVPSVAYKLMLQYRTSQMVFGTLFSLIPRTIFEGLSHTTLIVIYKMIHWVTFYIVGISIIYVVQRHYIKRSKESWKNVMAWIISFYLVFGIPMTISVMKVCNYDASNVMLGTLAILLVGKEVIALTKKEGGGLSRNNFLYGKIGLLLSILGCLDKFSSGIYFIVCAVLYVFAKIHRENCRKVIKAFFESVKIIICALCIGYINLYYICFALAGGKLYDSIKFGHVAFSFTYIFQVVFEGMELVIGNKILFYIILMPFLISFLALLLYLVKSVFVKIRYSCKLINFINKLSAIILGLMIIIGIYGTYYVPQMLSPYASVEKGEFSSCVVWGTYHYGAYSWVGHKLSQIAYAFATVMSNYPTSVLLLFLVYIFVVLKKDIEEFCCQIVVLGSILLIAILACMNQPSDPRYFGVSILLLVICTWIVIYNNQLLTLNEKKRYKAVIGILFAFCIGFIELVMFVPNVKIFAPLWNYRSTQWKETIRPGQWDAGEAMSWGEELALAGRKINKLRQEDGLAEDTITIYSDYGTYWLLNPGYSILPISQADSSVQLNEATYFVFTKKRLFRMMELPPFLYEVEPIDTVEYRGEICSWIYKGSQLKEYQSYFAVD